MVKKISCKIISSKPLIHKGDVSPHINMQNNNHHKVDKNTACGSQAGYTHDFLTYSNSLNISKGFVHEDSIGEILDCYA